MQAVIQTVINQFTPNSCSNAGWMKSAKQIQAQPWRSQSIGLRKQRLPTRTTIQQPFDPNQPTKMHSSLVRAQNVFGFFTTVAFCIGTLIALSVIISPQTPTASIELRNVQV